MRSALPALVAALFALNAAATHAAAPTNDAFSAGQSVGIPQTRTATNVEATLDPGEPVHAGVTGGHSVWYRSTPSVDARMRITTCDSDFDTVLAVYTGATVEALTEIARNDNACGTASQADFSATAGTTYHIAVDGARGATGNISLLVTLQPTPPSPPPTCPPADAGADAFVYRGTHQQGGDVCMTVAADLKSVKSFQVTKVTDNMGCNWDAFHMGSGGAITDRRFSGVGFNGSFPTQEGAEGTLQVSQFVNSGLFTCKSPVLTWSASTDAIPPWPAPTPPPPPAPDTTAPVLKLDGARTQRALKRGGVIVRVRCPSERCTAKATGALSAPKASPLVRLRSATATIAAGRGATLKLKLPLPARRAIGAAMRRHRTVKATIAVAVIDAAGNKAKGQRTIKLVR